MKNILIYNIESEELEKISVDNDLTIAEVVEMLMEYVEDMKRDNKLI